MNVLRSRYAAIAAAAWLVVPAAVMIAAGGTEPRSGLFSGWFIAGVTGLVSFGLLAQAANKSVVHFMKALVWSFAVRLVLVSGWFYLTLRHRENPIWFCVGFFSFYWLSTVCEMLAYRQTVHRAAPVEALT